MTAHLGRQVRGVLEAALLAFLPLAIAAGLTGVVAALDARPFADAVLFPPEPIGRLRFAVALTATLSGYFAVFFAPGLLAMRALRLHMPNATAGALAAFTLSLATTSLAWVVAQGVTHGLAGRPCLYLIIAVLDAAALAAGVWLAPGAPALPSWPGRRGGTGRAELVVPGIGVVLLLAAAWATMPGKIGIEALDGDATEVHGFAASLFAHALPDWDLEAGGWGFYPTFMFVAYPVFESLALLGDTEAALRLPALLFFGVLVLAVADLAGRGRTRAAGGSLDILVPLLLAGYLSIQVGAYYAGYHPFHGDLGAVPLDEWVAAALGLAGLLLLRAGAPGTAAIASFLSIVSFPSGLLLALFVAAAGLLLGDAAQRRTILRWGLAVVLLATVYAAFVVILTTSRGSLDATIREWWAKYFTGRGDFGAESPVRMLSALGWWALLAGGLPIFGLVLGLFDRDVTTRWLATIGLLWTALFVLSPSKNIHYFLPVALLPAAVMLRESAGRERRTPPWLVPGVAAVSIAAAIALTHPRANPPYVADREFGRRSIFFAVDEREAVAFSHVLFNVMSPLWKWDRETGWVIGHHTWAMYADRGFDLARRYDFYVAQGPPPTSGLSEVTRIYGTDGRAIVFWARDGRAALREWKRREYPLRVDQSRFNFEFAPPGNERSESSVVGPAASVRP